MSEPHTDDSLRYVFTTLVHCPNCRHTKFRCGGSRATEKLVIGEREIELRRERWACCQECGHKFKIIFE